jgi:subtilisin family serine protease
MIFKRTTIASMVMACLWGTDSSAINNDSISDAASESLIKEALKGHPEAVYQTDKSKINPNVAGRAPFTAPYPEGQVIVRLKPGTDPGIAVARAQAQSKAGAPNDVQVLKKFPLVGNGQPGAAGLQHLLVLKSNTLTTAQFIARLKQDPSVDVAEPDYFVYANSTTPNDTRFGELWGMNNTGQTGGTPDADIDAPEAWDRITGNGSVIVGSIDTGVDYLHPDLIANMWRNLKEANGVGGVDDDGNGYIDDIYGIDAVNNDSDPMDDNNHGTHTMGTVGGVANNNEGVAGVAWNVKIAACKFLDASGSGSISDAIECVNYFTWLRQHGENIVATNNSWGGGGFSQTLKDAIDAAGAAGTLFVAAAGNNASNNDASPYYPVSYDSASIIAVAATDDTDNLAYFSNYGPTSVDLAAPGQGILSTVISTSGGCDFSPESATLFHDGFESGLGGWTQIGMDVRDPPFNNPAYWWTQDGSLHYTGSYSASDSVGNYQDYTLSSAWTASNLSAAPAGQLCGGLWIKGNAENGLDYLTIYLSKDNGTNWTPVLATTGEYADWTKLTFPIPDDYKTSSFRIGLVRTNDDTITYDGYHIDDVGIGLGSVIRTPVYAAFNGTSMATPHVSGAVALAAMAFPGESVAARKARILAGVDAVPALSGYVATGGRLNLAKVVDGGTDNLLRWPDVNGDAKYDLVWRNYSTGQNMAWNMDGARWLNSISITKQPDVNWRIVGTPDMNYDGKPDLLWRNQSTGANQVWYMNGNVRTTSVDLSPVADLNWRIVGTPDMNGDGKPDILWRSYSTGANKIWYMNGPTMTSSANLTSMTDLNWRIVGTPDMNNDGKPDILWRNLSTGANQVWFMNGTIKMSSANLASYAGSSLRIVATPDVNRDGKPDILWRNNATGANEVWYMNGTAKTSSAALPSASVGWYIENNGDF